MDPLETRARELAERQLAEHLSRRWAHVQAVASKAEWVASALFRESDAAVLVASAWLHDVGYAPNLSTTGFHPLDGVRWLRQIGFDERVASLVAHHSCAHLEAAERGLAEALASEFSAEDSAVADALWYADMTGPDG